MRSVGVSAWNESHVAGQRFAISEALRIAQENIGGQRREGAHARMGPQQSCPRALLRLPGDLRGQLLDVFFHLPIQRLQHAPWRSATVTAIVLPDDEEQAGGPKDTDMLGAKISSGCIGYRMKADDGIYVLEYCLNPLEQHDRNSKSPFEGAPDVTLHGVVRIWGTRIRSTYP